MPKTSGGLFFVSAKATTGQEEETRPYQGNATGFGYCFEKNFQGRLIRSRKVFLCIEAFGSSIY